MSSSNKSDLENNFSKKGKSDKCSSKNGLSGGLREGFSHILPYHLNQRKKKILKKLWIILDMYL